MKNIYRPVAIALTVLSSIFVSDIALASSYVVGGTSISLFTQSQVESTGHMMQSSVGILNGGSHPWCANRMYIESGDKALYAAALDAWLSGKLVNIIYDDASPGVYIAGHVGNLQCKVLSIW